MQLYLQCLQEQIAWRFIIQRGGSMTGCRSFLMIRKHYKRMSGVFVLIRKHYKHMSETAEREIYRCMT